MMNTLKQLVGWVIVLRRKFQYDIFFSTRVKIVICFMLFIAGTVASFILLLNHSKRVFFTGIIESLLLAISNGVTDHSIITESSAELDTATYTMIVVIVLLAALCGLIVSRLALTPLRQAFTIQKRFISGIAHELRTPLSILRMNNEIAKFDLDPSSPLNNTLDENISDIDKINEILNNLLLFERMASIDSLKFTDIDMREIIEKVVGQINTLATQKDISIQVVPSPALVVLGNKTALEQAFFNIVKNAVSYTPAKGAVTIQHMGSTNHTIRISISDTGMGISEKDLPHIFQPFYRTNKVGKLSGTGIGLAVVLEIIKLHKGTIEVTSVEGVGSEFILSLPIKNATLSMKPKDAPVEKIAFDFSKR